MGLATKHPSYSAVVDRWSKMRDAYSDEDAIKAKGTQYLPTTRGMQEDGVESTAQEGFKAYNAYITRARYPEYVEEAIKGSVGRMHFKDAVVELPTAMEPHREFCSTDVVQTRLISHMSSASQIPSLKTEPGQAGVEAFP